MKLALVAAAGLLQAWSSEAYTNENTIPSVRVHPRGLVKRDGRDCGKFIMYCEKAAGACNNACYHTNCIDPSSTTMIYDAGNNNDKNRLQSGCQTSDGSVCNNMPFSQKLHDPFNSNPGDITINCDEWPMAAIKQDDYIDGTIRNSLRCIPAGENSSGGAQLSKWFDGSNAKGPKKTCSGDMQDGDHWTVEFNLDNVADASKVDHCKNPGNCDSDPYQFHMTKKNGHLSYPYDVDKDNHYALGKTQPDLLQCKVVVDLHGTVVTGTVYDVKGNQQGSQDGTFQNKEDSIIVKGLPLPLAIIYQADDSNPVAFNYGAADFFSTDLMKFFFWESNEKGSSKQRNDDGRYCDIKTEGTESVIDCYFPCVAAN